MLVSPVVFQSLFCLYVSFCLSFVFMSVGAGFDPPVRLTCWLHPVFRCPNVCIGLVGRTGRHCTTPVCHLKHKKLT